MKDIQKFHIILSYEKTSKYGKIHFIFVDKCQSTNLCRGTFSTPLTPIVKRCFK